MSYFSIKKNVPSNPIQLTSTTLKTPQPLYHNHIQIIIHISIHELISLQALDNLDLEVWYLGVSSYLNLLDWYCSFHIKQHVIIPVRAYFHCNIYCIFRICLAYNRVPHVTI